MRWAVTKWLFIAVLPVILVCSGWAVTLFESGYQVETYATYDMSAAGRVADMTFGTDDTLYISHHGPDVYARDGSIFKVTADGSVSVFADGLVHAKSIVWGTGTAYGDYLYICDEFENSTWSQGEVTRVDSFGNGTPFAGPGLDQPGGLEIDRTGNFGGYMYVASMGSDRITRVLPDGQTELLYSFDISSSFSPFAIDFDPAGRYDGLMYVAIAYGSDPQGGISTFDPAGNRSEFAPDIITAWELGFDTTGAMFDGDLFVYGSAGYGPRLFRVAPDGSAEAFAWLMTNGTFTFGPDGAIYVYEQIGTSAVISRIFDPSSFVDPYAATVESIEAAIAAKHETIAAIISDTDKDREVLEALDELDKTGEIDPNYIEAARRHVLHAINRQMKAIAELKKGISELERALEELEGTGKPGQKKRQARR